MEHQTVLCADSESLLHPEILGLEDERLDGQPWLALFCDAGEARQALRSNPRLDDVWVYSSDSMEGINLAAALKKDDEAREVSLITFGARVRLWGAARRQALVLFVDETNLCAGMLKKRSEPFMGVRTIGFRRCLSKSLLLATMTSVLCQGICQCPCVNHPSPNSRGL